MTDARSFTTDRFTNYMNVETSISTATTYDLKTTLGRDAIFVRLKTDADVTVKLNSGDDISVYNGVVREWSRNAYQTITITPSGATSIELYAD